MILVAGSSGHIGQELVKKCVCKGLSLRCFDIQPPALEGTDMSKIEFVQADITDRGAVTQALRGVETVLSVTGLKKETKEVTHEMVEHGGMKNLVTAGKENNVSHIMYISVMGVAADAPARTLQAKWNAEQTLINSGIPYTIFRPSGYFVDFSEIFAPEIKAKGAFRVPGDGSTRIQPIAPEDVAETMIRAIGNEKAKNRIFSLAGPEVFALREVVELVGRVVGTETTVKQVPIWTMKLLFTLMRSRSGKDFLYRATRDSILEAAAHKEVQEVFQVNLERLEPWLKARLPS
jgi:uncharacterized protein YbjT (DUF2867 family)